MKIKTHVKAGKMLQHNETLVRSAGLKVKSAIRAGKMIVPM